MPEMISVYAVGEQWFEVGAGHFQNETGGYPPGWAESASPEELVMAHAARIELPPTPAGKVQVGRSIMVQDFMPTVVLDLRDYTLEEREALAARRIAEIKAEARRRILAVMDKDQQDNALALGQEMIFTHGSDPASWPEEERGILQATLSKWSAIKAIRAASNAIEAALPADAASLVTFEAASAVGWPT